MTTIVAVAAAVAVLIHLTSVVYVMLEFLNALRIKIICWRNTVGR